MAKPAKAHRITTHRLKLTFPLTTAAAGNTLLINDASHRNQIDNYAISKR
jgi:hypothetical protein